jgi:hypothetical protein
MTKLTPNQRHILGTFMLATEAERYDGQNWYRRANAIARACSQAHGVPFLACVGVIAALSPNNMWDRNVKDAQNLIALFSIGGREAAKEVRVCTYGQNKEKAIQILERIQEPLQVHSTHDGTEWYGVGSDGKRYPPTMIGWHAGLDDLLAILKGPKVCEFASCILAADWHTCSEAEFSTVASAVCIDGHAWSIWFGERRTLKDVPSITPKLRAAIIADYRAVSQHLISQGDMFTPSEVQAVSWVTHRRIHLAALSEAVTGTLEVQPLPGHE